MSDEQFRQLMKAADRIYFALYALFCILAVGVGVHLAK